jgi:hypothetical protein
MKHKVSELQGVRLDAAVAKAEGHDLAKGFTLEGGGEYGPARLSIAGIGEFAPSANWSQGGPIIERERITILAPDERLDQLEGGLAIWDWTAAKYLVGDDENEAEFEQEGPTPLISAMRAYVSSKFGEEVDLP